MATSKTSKVIQHFRRAVLLQDGAGLTDAQLLECFIEHQDEAALAALVRRHAPTVWGVCHRVLCNYHDAEDAFQATFLVLVRKAASIASRDLLANWLYGVAHQTALKARATSAKRRARELQVAQLPEPATSAQDLWHDLQPLLDEELSRLPAKYRAVVVLCDLEGKTRKKASRQLSLPEGTVASRLATARTMLAKRLTKRGVIVSAGALGVMLSQRAGSACVPPFVVPSTIKAAILFAAGQAAAGLISVQVAALTEGVLAAMFLSKIKVAMGVLLVALVFTGTGVLISQATGSDGQEKNPQSTRRGIQEQKASQGGQTGKQVQKTTASVREIADIFGTNAALADEKFAGKQIAVTGRMRFIRAGGVTIDGKQVYDLYMGSEEPDLGRGPVVQFRFVVDDRKQLAKLRAWQRLTIEVKAKDYQVGSAGVCFSECIIMSVED